MSTNRKFSISYFLILAIFIAISINLRNTSKNRSLGLSSIIKRDRVINLNTLTPEEKTVWENFKAIPITEYKNRYEDITESIRPILNSPTDNHIGVTILEEILASKKLNPTETLFVLGKLSTLQISSGMIINSIKTNIEILKLAEELKSEYHTDRAFIALSGLISRLHGNETAIEILNNIPKSLESYPSKNRVEVMKTFHLAENYFVIKNNEEALKTLKDIDSLLIDENETYIQNVLAFKYTLEAQIAIDTLDKKLAKDKLLAAKELMDNAKAVYFTGFSNFYTVTMENYNLIADIDNFSENNLLRIISLLENKVNKIYLDEAYSLLFDYYYLKNDIHSYKALKISFDNNLKNTNSSNNEVLVLYLLGSLENRYIENQNMKLYRNLFILTALAFLAIFITQRRFTSYRVGGEEFAVIFVNIDENFAREVSEFIRRAISNISWEHDITVTISGGFSKNNNKTYLTCDKLLYKAKKSGKNLIIYNK